MNPEKFINPTNAYPKVFIFPIQNTINSETPYQATRRAWNVNEELRDRPFGIAVGIKDKISRSVFEIINWHPDLQADEKWEFDGVETDKTDEFYDTNWSKIIEKAEGYWRYGNYLVVEFNGESCFRFIKGKNDKQTWHSCL